MTDLVPTSGSDRLPATLSGGPQDIARRLRLRKLQAQHERDIATFVKEYLRIIWRRRLLIGIFTALVAGIVLVMTLRTQKFYRATAKISVDIGGNSVMPQADMTMNFLRMRGFLAKQIEDLKSATLARTVIEDLNLGQHPLFQGRYDSPDSHQRMLAMQRQTWEYAFREWFGTQPIEPPGPGESPDRRIDRRLVALFQQLVTIQQDNDSANIITITCVSPYPDLASRIPNGIAESYRKVKELEARSRIEGDRQLLEEKLEETEQQVSAAQRALQDFAEKEGYLALDKQIAEANRAITSYEDQAISARRTLLEARARHAQMREKPDQALTIRGASAVSSLLGEISRLERQYKELSQIYKDSYPDVADVKEQLAVLRDQYDREVQTTLASLELELVSAEANLASIEAEIRKRYEFYESIQEKYSRHERLREEVNNAITRRNSLLTQLGITNLQQGMTFVDVAIIDPAETPLVPFYPNTMRFLMIGVLAGLVVGTIFALVLEFMDNTVKSGEEIEEMLGLPALATIPLHEKSGAVKRRRIIIPGQKRIETVSHHEPRGMYAERFRFLRTAITYSTPGGKPHVIGFSSCLPREGKTTCSINTAITFAKRGLRVVLIDGDLKKPMVHKHFGLERQIGLTTLLTDNADLDDVIQPSPVQNLDVITAGHLPPNPTDLIESQAMKRVVAELKRRYDLVIFDSAPLFNIPDTNVLATHLEGLIIVVRAGSTPREVLKDIHDQLEALSIRVIGVVVNGVIQGKAGSYGYAYKYRYGYSYNYGYGYGYTYGGFKSEEPVKMRERKAGSGEQPALAFAETVDTRDDEA